MAIAVVSVGSTPTCAGDDEFPGVTEIHPGNYVFFDRQQQAVGGCQEEDIAASVLTRVVGHYRDSGHMLCDAGSLAMSKDKTPQVETGMPSPCKVHHCTCMISACKVQ